MAPPSSLENKTSPVKNTVLILLLALLGFIVLKTLYLSSQHEKSAANSAARVECYRAELLMRMADAMSYLPQLAMMTEGSSRNKVQDSHDTLVSQAKVLLENASKAEPDDAVILSKKIILESKTRDDVQIDLAKLFSIGNSRKEKDVSRQAKDLALIIHSIYGFHDNHETSSISKLPFDAPSVINKNLPDGWFREQALLRAYKFNNQISEQDALQEKILTRTWHYVFKIVLISISFAIAFLVGVIVLLYQVITTVNKPDNVINQLSDNTNTASASSLGYGWQTVAFVFVAWFFTQIFIGFIFSWLKQKGLNLEFTQSNSLFCAISIAAVYLLSNGPALLYIYFLALRPNGQKFIEGINLRFKVGKSGTIALIIIGILSWFAALPLVIAAYFISASFFGSSGSSNPIIGIVMEAAQANNVLTIFIFYLTLGVLAPLCEETLFRGFLYKYLRINHGVIVSNLASSTLFAAAHLDIGAILPLLCLGSIFACVYEKTKSILPAMIAHGLWNSATFTLVLLLFGS